MPAIGRTLDIPDYLVASIFSLSALTWAVSSPFWVKFISRNGPNLYIRAGLVGFILSMGGCALAVKLGILGLIAPATTFLLFFVLRSIYGLLGSASATATQSLIAEQTEGAERTRTLTALAGALSLGTIIGPAIAPVMIVEPLGPLGPMLGFAIFGIVALIGSYLFLVPVKVGSAAFDVTLRARPAPSLWRTWRRKKIGPHLTFGLFLSSAQAINIYTIGFAIIDRAGSQPLVAQKLVGITMAAGAVAALVAQWGLVRIFSPSPGLMMCVGAFFAFVGNVGATIDLSYEAAFWGFVLSSFGYGLARPGFSAAASLAGRSKDQVAIASAVTLIAGASITLPPIIAATAYQWWQPAPFAIAAAIAGALAFATLMGTSRPAIVSDER